MTFKEVSKDTIIYETGQEDSNIYFVLFGDVAH